MNKLCLRIKTDLTKILNPLTKPKPKTQHSFRLHEDFKHQSFPSSTISPYLMETNSWDAFRNVLCLEFDESCIH